MPKTKPHWQFLITGTILLIFHLFKGNGTLDINLHDTYFVISYRYWGGILFLLFALISFIFYLIRNQQLLILSMLHFAFTLPLFIRELAMMNLTISAEPTRYTPQSDFSNFNNTLVDSLGLTGYLFLFGQLLFVLNIVLSILKAIRQKMAKKA